MSPELQEAFDEAVGLAMDRQAHLSTLLEPADWEFDMRRGVIDFVPPSGERWAVPCQILGSESSLTDTWLWAWANEASGIPAPLLAASRAVRGLGDSRGIRELTEASTSLGDVDGHAFAAVASALHPSCAGYYRATHDSGALYLLLFSEALVEARPTPLVRLATGWPQVLQMVGDSIGDQRKAFAAYARALGLEVGAEGRGLVATGPLGNARVTFDEAGRTIGIEVYARGE